MWKTKDPVSVPVVHLSWQCGADRWQRKKQTKQRDSRREDDAADSWKKIKISRKTSPRFNIDPNIQTTCAQTTPRRDSRASGEARTENKQGKYQLAVIYWRKPNGQKDYKPAMIYWEERCSMSLTSVHTDMHLKKIIVYTDLKSDFNVTQALGQLKIICWKLACLPACVC